MCMYFPLLFMLAICTSNRYVVVPQWPTATAQQCRAQVHTFRNSFVVVDVCAVCSTYFLIFLETDRANLDARLTFHEIREKWKVYLLSRKLLFKNLKLCWWLFQMVFRPFYVTRIAWHAVHFWCPRHAHYFVLEFRGQFCGYALH